MFQGLLDMISTMRGADGSLLAAVCFFALAAVGIVWVFCAPDGKGGSK